MDRGPGSLSSLPSPRVEGLSCSACLPSIVDRVDRCGVLCRGHVFGNQDVHVLRAPRARRACGGR
eukprot:5524613-Prorocentrum_lima.AAC.1